MSAVLVDRVFPAQPERLCDIRHAVGEAAKAAGCPETIAQDVVLAVDEACQNIIRHAYHGAAGDIQIQVERGDGTLLIRLIDFAAPVDVTAICPRPLDDIRPGGLGTHFIREVMDEVSFLPPPPGAGNLLLLVKRIGEA